MHGDFGPISVIPVLILVFIYVNILFIHDLTKYFKKHDQTAVPAFSDGSGVAPC